MKAETVFDIAIHLNDEELLKLNNLIKKRVLQFTKKQNKTKKEIQKEIQKVEIMRYLIQKFSKKK
ncbi:hypothetical protein [Flavobacterium sp.]|uniref:hypothetical protein n=1 Tax=Flavobacterium sp. TaxID=239 RepID=UPI002B4B1021|nr:hypothetical protein [Flavobacterium sp.]HLF50942.1 hypothetical protein [Flavobacterium sp.]